MHYTVHIHEWRFSKLQHMVYRHLAWLPKVYFLMVECNEFELDSLQDAKAHMLIRERKVHTYAVYVHMFLILA